MENKTKLLTHSCEPNFTGYPLFYIVDYEVLCAPCAQEAKDEDNEIVETHCNWENPDLYCDTCSERIESAYGDE